MAILAKEPEGGNFTRILPPDGLQPAICCDVFDRGLVESEFDGEKRVAHKVSIHYLLADRIPARWTHPHTGEEVVVPADLVGKQYGISRWFTLSLHENSRLRHFLKTWRGRDFSKEELRGFDVEKLIRAPAALNIVHTYSEKADRYYANIEGVSKMPPGWDVPTIPADYVRLQDRPPRDGQPVSKRPQQEEAQSYTYGRSPDGDWTGEPIPSEPTDELPF